MWVATDQGVAERIRDRPEAVAPELIGDLHRNGRACVNSPLDECVDVLDVEEDARGCSLPAPLASSSRACGNGSESITRESPIWISGVSDLPVRRLDTAPFLGAERLLVVPERLCCVVDGQVGSGGVVALWNRLNCSLSLPPFCAFDAETLAGHSRHLLSSLCINVRLVRASRLVSFLAPSADARTIDRHVDLAEKFEVS